jgi:hypothetical protein
MSDAWGGLLERRCKEYLRGRVVTSCPNVCGKTGVSDNVCDASDMIFAGCKQFGVPEDLCQVV